MTPNELESIVGAHVGGFSSSDLPTVKLAIRNAAVQVATVMYSHALEGLKIGAKFEKGNLRYPISSLLEISNPHDVIGFTKVKLVEGPGVTKNHILKKWDGVELLEQDLSYMNIPSAFARYGNDLLIYPIPVADFTCLLMFKQIPPVDDFIPVPEHLHWGVGLLASALVWGIKQQPVMVKTLLSMYKDWLGSHSIVNEGEQETLMGEIVIDGISMMG